MDRTWRVASEVQAVRVMSANPTIRITLEIPESYCQDGLGGEMLEIMRRRQPVWATLTAYDPEEGPPLVEAVKPPRPPNIIAQRLHKRFFRLPDFQRWLGAKDAEEAKVRFKKKVGVESCREMTDESLKAALDEFNSWLRRR